jgi:hypothetical protein
MFNFKNCDDLELSPNSQIKKPQDLTLTSDYCILCTTNKYSNGLKIDR